MNNKDEKNCYDFNKKYLAAINESELECIDNSFFVCKNKKDLIEYLSYLLLRLRNFRHNSFELMKDNEGRSLEYTINNTLYDLTYSYVKYDEKKEIKL